MPLVEGLFVCDAGAVFGLEFFGHLLDLAEDAQQVAAENLAAVFGGVAPCHQGFRDLWQIGGGVDTLWRLAGDAVEV